MPSDDLERAFAALSGDAGQARLVPAAALRKRADRQTMTRSVAGVAAAVVLVAGVLVGSRLALTDNALPPLPPSQSHGPTSAPPSVTPAPLPSVARPDAPSSSSADAGSQGESSVTRTSDPPTIPASIPDRAFLRSSDLNGGKPKRLSLENHASPKFCGAAPDYSSEDELAIRARFEALYEDGRADHTPLSVVFADISIYRADGAETFIDEFRAMVKKCPQNALTTHRSVGSLGLGDESQLIRSSSPAGGDDGELSEDGDTVDTYHAVVRVGDTVLYLSNSGYESQTVDREDAEALFGKAVRRLTDWRG